MGEPSVPIWVQVTILLALTMHFWGFSVAWKPVLSFLAGTEMPWGQEWEGRVRDS